MDTTCRYSGTFSVTTVSEPTHPFDKAQRLFNSKLETRNFLAPVSNFPGTINFLIRYPESSIQSHDIKIGDNVG